MTRVLIADDASFIREILREILEPAGFEVVAEARNGAEAVEMWEQHHPDIVMMDIVMPKKSGIEAVKIIIGLDPTAKIVMCGALCQEALMAEALRAGARDFVFKPYEHEEIVAIIKKAMI